jgi:Cytochrome c554 and c-prime
MKILSKYFSGYRLIIAVLVLLIYAGSSMCSTETNIEEVKTVFGANDNYVGSYSCTSCHRQIYDSYVKTAHFRTSSPVDSGFGRADYKANDTVFYTTSLFVAVQRKTDGIYQTAYSSGRIAASHSIDLVVGSGRKGQTFLFWNNRSLYQLPLSYSFAYHRWINSPGYPADKALFNRTIPVKCFECHASYTRQTLSEESKPVYDTARMVLGISCETCHGPGRMHVQYHKENPKEKNAKFIINTKNLNRDRKLDACAMCHSGLRENIKPAFSFLPGDRLEDFFKPPHRNPDSAELDVHGNQYGLLTASKCFKQSAVLNCSSCHNVHQNERSGVQVFARRCMNCHQEQTNNFCTVKNIDKPTLISQCINCHMPLQASGTIAFSTGSGSERLYDSIRTHLIGIYRDIGFR